MRTKTFKIGERCQGGIITIEKTKDTVAVIGKQWDFSKGTRKSSDQSGAKEFTRKTYGTLDPNYKVKVWSFLLDLTDSYHADQIMKYITYIE